MSATGACIAAKILRAPDRFLTVHMRNFFYDEFRINRSKIHEQQKELLGRGAAHHIRENIAELKNMFLPTSTTLSATSILFHSWLLQ